MVYGQPAATRPLAPLPNNHRRSILGAFLVLGAIATVIGWWGVLLGVLILVWAIAGTLGKLKGPAALVFRDSISAKKLPAISLGLGGFVTTCGVMGVAAPTPQPSTEVEQPRTYGSDASVANDPALANAAVPRNVSSVTTTPSTGVRANSLLELFKNEDRRSGLKDQKARVLLIQGTPTEAQLRKALTDYYLEVRAELEHSPNKVRHVWLFAFPTEARAKAGMGEWHGRAKAIAMNGDPLPLVPELTIQLPSKDVPQPTAREDAIYDMLMEELYAEDSSADYRKKVLAQRSALTEKDRNEMLRLDELDVKRAKKRVAKHFKITLKKLQKVEAMVSASRQ